MRRQSEHSTNIGAALDRLEAKGVLYPCFCTRREIQAEIAARRRRAARGRRAGLPRHLPPSPRGGGRRPACVRARDFALRLDVARACALTGPLEWHDSGRRRQARPALLGDVVLARKEMPASYHLAVTVDDAIQGVTLVTRGEDLAEATHIHRLLQALLDLPTPLYRHHPLLADGTAAALPSATALRRSAQCGKAASARPMSSPSPAPPRTSRGQPISSCPGHAPCFTRQTSAANIHRANL